MCSVATLTVYDPLYFDIWSTSVRLHMLRDWAAKWVAEDIFPLPSGYGSAFDALGHGLADQSTLSHLRYIKQTPRIVKTNSEYHHKIDGINVIYGSPVDV